MAGSRPTTALLLRALANPLLRPAARLVTTASCGRLARLPLLDESTCAQRMLRRLPETSAAGPRFFAADVSRADSIPAMEEFRRRASAELSTVLSTVLSGGASARLGEKLRSVADEELAAAFGEQSGGDAARSACGDEMERDVESAITLAAELEESHREQRLLKTERADHLAVGFQTTGSENQEFASLVVCATAGIFAVSVHYGFFAVFGVAYIMYRRSTAAVRKQRASAEQLQEVIDRIRELQEDDVGRLAALQRQAAAWAGTEAKTRSE